MKWTSFRKDKGGRMKDKDKLLFFSSFCLRLTGIALLRDYRF